MRIAIALITIVGGVALAATWVPTGGNGETLAVVTEVGNKGVAKVSVPAAPAPQVTQPDGSGPTEYRFFGFPVAFGGINRARLPDPDPSSWQAEVVAPVPSPAVRHAAAAMPAGKERSRQDLVRELQRELRRVGCYAGDVDGDWGSGSRRGMKSFLERAGSAHQSDEPDMIQLTLVRGHATAVCGAPCPPERMSPGTGRCLSGPMVARRANEKGDAARPDPAVAAAPLAVPSPTLAARPAASPAAVGGAGTVATAPDVAPPQAGQTVLPPLPGRMAVGGPAAPSVPGLAIPTAALPAATAPGAGPDARRVRPSPQAGQRPIDRAHPPARPRAASAPRSERSWTATFFNN